MESGGNTYISLKYTAGDYNGLALSISSSNENWSKAIKIYSDRIDERYILPLNNIINQDQENGCEEQNAFVIAAIECLLIETMMQFFNGWEKTKGNNTEVYKDFLSNEFNGIFDEYSGKIFYEKIRCGILHQAQTKGHCKLTVDTAVAIEKRDKNIIAVNPYLLFESIRKWNEEYKCKLMDDKQEKLRENFIKKMNSICKE